MSAEGKLRSVKHFRDIFSLQSTGAHDGKPIKAPGRTGSRWAAGTDLKLELMRFAMPRYTPEAAAGFRLRRKIHFKRQNTPEKT